jgi:hypothetical protein
MINQILLDLGSFFLFFWGIAHLFPTKSVVKGFGDISLDNKRCNGKPQLCIGKSALLHRKSLAHRNGKLEVTVGACHSGWGRFRSWF